MLKHVFDIWVRLFAHPRYRRLNSFLFGLSIRGLGVLNTEDYAHSGEAWLLKHYLKKLFANGQGRNFFDVGANDGSYAEGLIDNFPKASVFTFEPHPDAFSGLQRRLSGKPIRAFNFGFSAENASAELFDYEASSGSPHASIHGEVIEKLFHGRAKAVPITLKTIDGFCEEEQIDRIDFLKIDVEGHELACLNGAKRMIAENRIGLIQFEFNQMNVYAKVFMQDFFDLLPNYELFRLLPASLLRLRRDDTLMTNLFHFQNIVAIPARAGLSAEMAAANETRTQR